MAKVYGFSLIELLVAVTIMLVMVGMGLASYLNFNEKQTVLQATKELETYLQLAQSKAQSGDVPAGCDQLVAYTVNVGDGACSAANKLCLKAVCNNGGSLTEITRSPEYNWDEDLVANNLGVGFRVLQGGLGQLSEGSWQTLATRSVIVSNQAGTISYQFTVSQGGEIGEIVEVGEE
ncbi:MAG: prepilin-type N-terminal cleavage/methylation domain-containing protein [Candidatus Pacebacteria bacterium]|nr:prepilin-type N-terminal cleavage/methylation domain-containing protein [Candidatus Paceibacterota bacterium]